MPHDLDSDRQRRTPGYNFVAGVGQSIVSTISSSLLSPLTRATDQVANFGWSNVLPDVSSLMSLYHAGRLNPQSLYRLAGTWGVHFAYDYEPGTLTRDHQSWADLLDLSRPTLDIGTCMSLFQQERLDIDDLRSRFGRLGMNRTDIAFLELQGPVIPVSTAIELRNKGISGDDEIAYAARRAGYGTVVAEQVMPQLYNSFGTQEAVNAFWIGTVIPFGHRGQIALDGHARDDEIDYSINAPLPFSPADAMILHWRGYVTQDVAKNHIRAVQTRGGPHTDAYFDSLRPMPGPSDLVRFAVRDVWQADIVQRFGYDEEFPDEFAYFMTQQGMNWGQSPVTGSEVGPDVVSWPQAYWRSHWEVISPTQAYDCFHRFRPNRVGRYQADVPNLPPFTFQDLQTILKTADYPPIMRPWLAAASFNPLRLSDIRNAFFLGIVDIPEATELFRDRGQTLADARVSAELLRQQKELKDRAPAIARQKAAEKQSIDLMIQSYEDGFITSQLLQDMLARSGISYIHAQLIVRNLNAKEQHRKLTNLVKRLKKDYMDGIYGADTVVLMLSSYGIVQERIAAIMLEWNAERSIAARAFTTANILKYVKEGLLSRDGGLARLINLGWNNADALIQLASAEAVYLKAQAKARAAEEQSAAKRAAALRKIQEDLKKERKRIAKEIAGLTPVSTLKAWYLDGTIGRKYVIEQMSAMLYPLEVIERYIQDWDVKKGGKKDAKGTGEASPSSGNGTGASG